MPKHAVLIGDNNTGKSTILEAIDLALGPDRLSRRTPIDEHDFYEGHYLPLPNDDGEGEGEPAPVIRVEVCITDLSDEQEARFGNYLEWLDTTAGELYADAGPEGVDADEIESALRVTFVGEYSTEEDDFVGNTYYTRTIDEEDSPVPFTKRDKQHCGFLFLRSLRTGSRALSLEHGSLLDIILRLKEIRPQMWEGTLNELAALDVAGDPALGVSGVLESIDASLKKYVPREWGVKPQLRVSNLTRDHLRKVISAFIAMLSQIAADKQNVIFAMEEVETAIPPYAQKRIVHELRKLSAQSILTSHSPYVLEEFEIEETVILSRTGKGELIRANIDLPSSVKRKRYRQEFRTRFCEGLLSRRVLIAEGATEATCLPAAARRLSELNSETYSSLEALGLCVIDAGSETQIADLASLYSALGKRCFAACDRQPDEAHDAINEVVDKLFMHNEKGIEALVTKTADEDALKRYAGAIKWPPHILKKYPNPSDDIRAALRVFFKNTKGSGTIADFIAECDEDEMPEWIKETCAALKIACEPAPPIENDDDGGLV